MYGVKYKHNQTKYGDTFIKEIKDNIKLLNKSMSSIEKMINKSKAILSTSKESSTEIKNQSNCMTMNKDGKRNPLFQRNYLEKQMKEINGTVKKLGLSKSNKTVIANKKKENHMENCLKQPLYHFSPQKTNSIQGLSTNKKNISMINPQKISIKSTHRRIHSLGNQKIFSKNSINKTQQPIKIKKSNILKGDSYQFKTQYNFQKQKSNTSLNNTQQNHGSKSQICIKLFSNKTKKNQEEKKLREILQQRNFIVYPPQFLTKKTQADQLQTIDLNRNKFIQKISQYKFVQNYLNKNQIWQIYNKITIQNIPQLKWPIIIVDQVYKKIQNQ